jgi:hypothetical protein
MVKVNGCAYFRNKREKLEIWKQLKQEFGEAVTIKIQDKVITYSCYVPRHYM